MLAVVTAAIPGTPGEDPPSILARFARKGTTAGAQILGEGSFRVEGDGADRVAQARLVLDAGPWEATVLSVETATGVSRIFKGHVDPLPAGSALHLSDVVLASAMASSSPATFMIGSNGPKVSSRMQAIVWSTSTRTVGG